MRIKSNKIKGLVSFCIVSIMLVLPSVSLADEEGDWYIDANAESTYSYSVIQGGLLDGEEDQEFQQFIDLYGTRTSGGRTYAISFFGNYVSNLSNPDASSYYYDTLNTFDGSQKLDFYQGYLDAQNPFGPDVLGFRVGRQSYLGAEAIRFDGGRIYLQDSGFTFMRLDGFVGQYVSLWDDDPPDEIPWGGGIQVKMWPGSRVHASVIHFLDYSWNVDWRQSVGSRFLSEIEFRGLNGYARDLSVDVFYDAAVIRTTFIGGYYQKFGPDDEEEGYDEYLFDYTSTDNNAPDYNEYRLERLLFTPIAAHKDYSLDLEVGFLSHRIVPSLGSTLHQLDDSNDEDFYNADYNLYRASLDIRDLPFQRFSLMVRWERTDEMRDVSDEEAVLDDFSAFAAQSFFSDHLEVSANASIKSYKYLDYDTSGSSYGGEITYHPCPFASIAVNYETIVDDLYEEYLGVDRIDEITAFVNLRY